MKAMVLPRIGTTDERGAVSAEYAILVAVVALAIIVGVAALGTALAAHYANAAVSVGG
jgi:Flp pilus assembly pilin Flp